MYKNLFLLKFFFQFIFHRFGDFCRGSCLFLLFAPSPLVEIGIRIGEPLDLGGPIDSFYEPRRQLDFDFIKVIPNLDLRWNILP
jgi:hypothetical protein